MQLAEKYHLEMVLGGFEKLVLLSFYYKKNLSEWGWEARCLAFLLI